MSIADPVAGDNSLGIFFNGNMTMNNNYQCNFFRLLSQTILILVFAGSLVFVAPVRAEFQAGAAVVDVTPEKLPVFVNGGMRSRSLSKINTRVNARAIALSDGKTRIAIVVVDSCMMPRPLLDEVKENASKKTGIPTTHILISATHTHSAPASMSCLGTDADPNYVPFLKKKIVEAIELSFTKLQPAKIGFGKADAAEFTALRRWIRRPGKIINDPFGNPTGRANMHSGSVWDNVTGESGPEDPDLSIISIQATNGQPIAVLGNFSMHYFGDRDISADYFGLFSEGLKEKIAKDENFVGIMSHGCSGDIWRRDYTKPDQWNPKQTIQEFANGLLGIALQTYENIEYQEDADLAMSERRMTLKYRVPDAQRLQWAKKIMETVVDRLPTTSEEVYAREQIILHQRQQTEIVMQGIRIGNIGIATTPNETYAITGLKIKAASPLDHNIVIELANGGDGYIPPPEQHLFGGYNTWAARSAGLEVTAEPKIAEACIELLEKVAGKPRKDVTLSKGPAATAIAKSKPDAWWRLDEFSGQRAVDSSGNHRDAVYESRVTYFLEGPRSEYFCKDDQKNRAVMFVGERLRGRVDNLEDKYSVSLWLWNGMPNDGRDVSGWFFSRGTNYGLGPYSDHLGIGGTSGNTGKLIFLHGDDMKTVSAGKTEIPRWKWQHVILVRDGESVRVYLNGKLEIETTSAANFPTNFDRLFLGGRSDNSNNWEGRLDEIAIYRRALSKEEIESLCID